MLLENLTALITLTAMEIVLGIDNIIFIAIFVSKLPAPLQEKARRIGIFLALFVRVGLLFALTWIMSLTVPFFTYESIELSGRSLILIGGGLFLVAKSTREIHEKVTGEEHLPHATGKRTGFASTIVQILLIDVVFSLDSVITAVGMANNVSIMVTAMVISMAVMLVLAKSVSHFVDKNPTIKILAMSFLILIGMMLVMEGFGSHIPKGYIYFAMFFSLTVEMLNIRYRRKARS